MMVYGEESAAAFLRRWLADKQDVILLTGRASYERCSAEAFLSRFLATKRCCHLTTVGENARKEDVDAHRLMRPLVGATFLSPRPATPPPYARGGKNAAPTRARPEKKA